MINITKGTNYDINMILSGTELSLFFCD